MQSRAPPEHGAILNRAPEARSQPECRPPKYVSQVMIISGSSSRTDSHEQHRPEDVSRDRKEQRPSVVDLDPGETGQTLQIVLAETNKSPKNQVSPGPWRQSQCRVEACLADGGINVQQPSDASKWESRVRVPRPLSPARIYASSYRGQNDSSHQPDDASTRRPLLLSSTGIRVEHRKRQGTRIGHEPSTPQKLTSDRIGTNGGSSPSSRLYAASGLWTRLEGLRPERWLGIFGDVACSSPKQTKGTRVPMGPSDRSDQHAKTNTGEGDFCESSRAEPQNPFGSVVNRRGERNVEREANGVRCKNGIKPPPDKRTSRWHNAECAGE
ncbi:unnamed protein product [Protopolystoma xenopodis]|uniref:Uncharacterized protein n=1 Tax=Protopolystoma xenopodis TaxID=117903 RepID=A0A3S4ZTF8_9PLAT|nr:unnamed protein product [Protopolystoma xenopodis]